MSRGLGKVGQAIVAAFAAEPANAFLAEELIERVYPGLNRIEKKHRVAVLRAAKSLATPEYGISWFRGGGLGGRLVFFSKYSVLSYAMARLKGDGLYKPNDPRLCWSRSEDELRAKLLDGGDSQRLVVEGGHWWRHVQQWIAERDGDTETVSRMEAENDRLLAALGANLRR